MKALAPVLAFSLLLGSGTMTGAWAQPDQSTASIKAHMAFLASDRLKGREAGSPEFDLAADYVATQMKQLGLQPPGNQSYFQPVPLVAFRVKDQGAITLQDKSGRATPLQFGKDYVVSGYPLSANLDTHAPLVFVGFGLVAPEHGRDDYRGLDVKGKIVVALNGAPKFLQTEERAYYRSLKIKLATAQAHGAIGFVSVNTPTAEKLRPFANVVRQYRSWGMTWRKPDGKPFVSSPLPVLTWISLQGARKFLGTDTDKILAAAEASQGNVRGFALPFSLHAMLRNEIKTEESKNIIGLLPGSDPKLKNEYIVLSGKSVV